MDVSTSITARKSQARAALDFPFTAPVASTGLEDCLLEWVEVATGLLWLRLPMPMALDHINVYLLEDHDGWFIVDTGLSTATTKAIWQQVATDIFQSKPVKGILCTHFHYDHASLARWLMQTFQAPLYMTYGEYFTLRSMANTRDEADLRLQRQFYHRCGVPDALIEAMQAACRDDPFMGHYPPEFRRLREGDCLKIGERHWQVLIGEGHSPEHACLYCADEALLIAGDQILPEISSNILVADLEPEAEPLSRWLNSLARLNTLSTDTLVMPSHGPVFKNIQARVAQLQAHHQAQLDLLRQMAQQHAEFTAYEAMQWLFNRPLNPIETMLAQGETLAHLSWLKCQGELQQFHNAQGIACYCTAQITDTQHCGDQP